MHPAAVPKTSQRQNANAGSKLLAAAGDDPSARAALEKERLALAAQQTKLTESEVAITVQSNQGKADYQRAVQQASTTKTLAEADAELQRLTLLKKNHLDEQYVARRSVRVRRRAHASP